MNVMIPVFSPPTGTWGSLTRVMALARKFESEGHSVTFCASGIVKGTLDENDFNVYPIPEATILGLPKFLSNLLAKKSHQMSPPVKEGKSFGNIWLLYFFMGYGKKKFLLNTLKSEIKVAKNIKADLIITEMEIGAYLVSYILKKPIVTTYAHIAHKGEKTFFYNRIANTLKSVLGTYKIKQKLKPDEVAFGPRVLKIIPSLPELDTTDPAREDVCYTGNLLEPIVEKPTNFIPEKDKKYIFCYFGTGSIPFSRIVKILPAVLMKFPSTVCYVASQAIKEEFKIGNVNFVKYIQASEILPHSIITICHGGLNTITQSLEAGVPLLMFPGPIFERRYNSERVELAKGGFFGELSDFNTEWLSQNIRKAGGLELSKIKESFSKYKGVETAYDYIEKWLQRTSVANFFA